MKITYESYGKTTSVSTDHEDITADELYDILYSICISQGWLEETLKEIFVKNG